MGQMDPRNVPKSRKVNPVTRGKSAVCGWVREPRCLSQPLVWVLLIGKRGYHCSSRWPCIGPSGQHPPVHGPLSSSLTPCVHRVIRRTRWTGARTRASARRPWPGPRPSSRRLHKRADAVRPGRPGRWGRVGPGVEKAEDPVFAHALRPVQQPRVRLRGRRFRLDVLYRQQVVAGGLSGLERRGG